MLSVVEGGGSLAVRSTVDGRSDATVTLRNLGETELPALEIAVGLARPPLTTDPRRACG